MPEFTRSVPIAKLDLPKRIAYGVVLEPDVEDLQGDVLSPDEIEKAAHQFLVDSRLINEMHVDLESVGEVVESYVAPADLWLGDQLIRKGSWVMATRFAEELFAKIASGEYTGYSIEGIGRREPLA